jgi:hypothetical protein
MVRTPFAQPGSVPEHVAVFALSITPRRVANAKRYARKPHSKCKVDVVDGFADKPSRLPAARRSKNKKN